jgi:hypothetical protein
LIIGIAFISGCVEEDTVPSAENVTPETPALIVNPYTIYIKKSWILITGHILK